jgi:hypothetical protein
MNRKLKKRFDLLQQKLHHLKQQRSGARKQLDDPEELRRVEAEVTDVEREIESIKKRMSEQ